MPVSEVGALASSLTSCVPSVTAMTFLIKAPPSPSRRSHAVRDRPVMPGTRPTVGHAVRDRPAIPASMVNSGVKPPARRSTSAASEPSGGSSSRIDSTFENGEVANWGKFRDNEEFLSLIEADIQRAERSLVLDAKKKKAYKSILAIWKRSRPRGWQASQGPRSLVNWDYVLHPITLKKLRSIEEARLKEERETQREALAVHVTATIFGSILEDRYREAMEAAARAKKLADAEEARRRKALRELEERLAREAAEAARREADRLRQLAEREAYRAWMEQEAERILDAQLTAEVLAVEVGRRRKVNSEHVPGIKVPSTWFTPQTVDHAKYTPNSIPWKTFQPVRKPSGRIENRKARAEAAVLGSFVDGGAVRPKTPVLPPPVVPTVRQLSPRSPRFDETGHLMPPVFDPKVTAFVQHRVANHPTHIKFVPPPPRTSLASIRRTQSLETLPEKRNSLSRGGVRSIRSTAHLNVTPIKGKVPFGAPGVLAPVESQPDKVRTDAHEACASVAYIGMAMAGGPSQLLPVVDIDDLVAVLEMAQVPLDRWNEERILNLFKELETLEAAIFSWNEAAEREALARPPAPWPHPPPRDEKFFEDEEDDNGGDMSTVPQCPHLLLKRRVLRVHLLSPDGELELMRIQPHPLGRAPSYRRLGARLTDRDWPVGVAVALVKETLGVEETQIRQLEPQPRVFTSQLQRASYPGLRCEHTVCVVRLHVEGISQHGMGDWVWRPTSEDEIGPPLPPPSMPRPSSRSGLDAKLPKSLLPQPSLTSTEQLPALLDVKRPGTPGSRPGTAESMPSLARPATREARPATRERHRPGTDYRPRQGSFVVSKQAEFTPAVVARPQSRASSPSLTGHIASPSLPREATPM